MIALGLLLLILCAILWPQALRTIAGILLALFFIALSFSIDK